jgi:hypothetical protein
MFTNLLLKHHETIMALHWDTKELSKLDKLSKREKTKINKIRHEKGDIITMCL